jgi:hypothetical protein
MNLNPTNHPLVFTSEYFTDPKHPLIQTKVIYAKIDDVLYYTTVHRGPTTDDLQIANGEVKSVELGDTTGFDDDETEAFNRLVKAIERKT